MKNIELFSQGRILDVKAAKVVSGLEPEFTNMFLIALAQCASDPRLDNAEAVRRCLNGQNPGDQPPPVRGAVSNRTSALHLNVDMYHCIMDRGSFIFSYSP